MIIGDDVKRLNFWILTPLEVNPQGSASSVEEHRTVWIEGIQEATSPRACTVTGPKVLIADTWRC